MTDNPASADWLLSGPIDQISAALPPSTRLSAEERNSLARDIALAVANWRTGTSRKDYPAPSNIRKILISIAKHASALNDVLSALSPSERQTIEIALGAAAENYAEKQDKAWRSDDALKDYDFDKEGPVLRLWHFAPERLPDGTWHYGGYKAMDDAIVTLLSLAKVAPYAVANADTMIGKTGPSHEGDTARRWFIREMAACYHRATGFPCPPKGLLNRGHYEYANWQPFMQFMAAISSVTGIKATQKQIRSAFPD